MARLPGFRSVRNLSDSSNKSHDERSITSNERHDEKVVHAKYGNISSWQLHRATRTRKIFSLISSFFFFIAVIFLILVEIGNISNKPVLRNTWFINLNLSNIIPESVPNAVLLNSIARTIGLHDFYQVGLWNYCEGYNGQGVTDCSNPRTLYWFDPVQIIVSQLLAGASIALPNEIVNILGLLRLASHWMFVCFLIGIILSFIMILLCPIAVFSRWLAFLIIIPSFGAALFTIAGAVIATVMFVIMRNAFAENAAEINIVATIGVQMFAFMWVAAAFTLFAFIIQLCLICCCASRRDIKSGRKLGNKHASIPGKSQNAEE